MSDSDNVTSYYANLLNKFCQENSPCHGIENVSIIVTKKRQKKTKKHNVYKHAQQPTIAFRLSRSSKPKKSGTITRHSSMPELNKCAMPSRPQNKSRNEKDTEQKKYKQSPFQSKFIANMISEHRLNNCFMNPFNYPSQTKWKIYRCQLGAVEDSCCCSCNSDAMFEVMKGLYDCYKSKNCDNCDCVLCSYKTKAEKKLGELRKSMTSVAREKVLDGKTPAQKETILNEMVKLRMPFPAGKTPSEKSLIDNIRKKYGLPPSPKIPSEKAKMKKAEAAGIITPLEGKTAAQKEKILNVQADFGLPLPEGRTPSEKALIEKIKASKGIPISVRKSEFQEKGPTLGAALRKAKADGLMTPLQGKTPEEKEKLLKELAKRGIPLPEGISASEKKLIDKVRNDLGLPMEPKTRSIREKHEQAAKIGLLEPLDGKTPAEKEKILKGLHDMGIPLPEGRTPSEEALVAKIKASPRTPSATLAPSERMRRAKAEGLLTPLEGKTPEQKEKILKGLAMKGLPLPEAKTLSEKKLIDKVREDLGLPAEPKTRSIRDKHEKAAKLGLLQPLEGKSLAEKEKTLKGLHELGIPLPEGRTPSEKALVAKIKSPLSAVTLSEKLRRAKAEGLLTPLKGKTPEQKEKILKGLAMTGLPLPEAQTLSDKKLIDKVRADLGLPAEPKTKSIREKHEQAAKFGLLQPLEGKTPTEKEKILKGLHELGIPLPEGRTPSEKALLAKIKPPTRAPSLKTAGLLTPIKGKTPEEKDKILRGRAMKGLPLPEGETPSEKKLIDKVRADLGLPAEPKTKSIREKHEQAAKFGLLQPLEGKTPAEKEKILKGLHELGIPLPEGRTPSEKALVAKIKPPTRAPSLKTAGLLTPIKGKTPEEKEKILRGRAMKGLPLPEGETPSEKKLIDKVRADLGLPAEPKTKSIREKHEQAARAGILQPLEGKTPAEKEKILKGLHELGIPLPEGRTPSEKALVAKIKPPTRAPSLKTAGLLTPIKGKTSEEKEKILRGRAMKGLLLPEGETPSEKKLIDKVRTDLGLPAEPKTKSIRERHEQAAKAGLLQPLEGKTPEEKEKILKGLVDLGIPLPEGRTPSEKALIAKLKAPTRVSSIKTAGLMTPLMGKSLKHKEKILRARAIKGLPLPEGQTPSEKMLTDKVRTDLGLPIEPRTKSIRDKHEQAAKVGLLQPLEGKTPEEKERILKGLQDMGIPLPEGRTPSEKALVAKIKTPPSAMALSEKLRRAKAEGLLTPLKGKTPEQKEKILKGLAMKGLPLPEGQTPSEKKLIDTVRRDLGLPAEPKTKSIREKHEKAAKAGLLKPLEGKKPEEKEKILRGLADLGIPLPEGRTPSEKALIAKVKAPTRVSSIKTAGLMTPLTGKSPEHKEKILRARAIKGLPLPEGQTPSEKKLTEKVRADLGLPIEPRTKSIRDKHEQAATLGLLQPLEGKTPAEKEKILKGLHDMGIPLPEGRTPSEKALVAKIKTPPSAMALSEKLRRAKAEGLLTPLKGKTPEQKEKILKGLAMKGLPLPEGQTPSEKKLINTVRGGLGLPAEPKTKSIREKHETAAKAGLLKPLEGKTPEEKEKILRGLADLGIPLPEGRSPSEKALIAKVKAPTRVSSIKTAGLMTPLTGKSPEHKEKILRARAIKGLPLPEGQTPSEKMLTDKVRTDLGLPTEPKTKSIRDKHEQAAKLGLLQPLEGKTPEEKEKILKGLHNMGIPLPEGRTPSEKALVAKLKTPPSVLALSEKLRRAKAEGLLTPLKGKAPEEKEKIIQGLAMKGLPLPEGQTPSEKKVIDKVRADLGLPREPKTKSLRDKHEQAAKAGLLQPLEGKTPDEKEKILKGLADMGIPLPEGRTPSEKALIAKVKGPTRVSSIKTTGLMTPLTGKSPEHKEKILRARAIKGLPLPEGQSPSEKKLIDKVRGDLGLPTEPKTKSIREKHEQAAKLGILQPLEGKTPAEKENILKGLHDLGVPLPEGRTPSEKALVAQVKATPRTPSAFLAPSERLRRAKAEGLLSPLEGKTPEQKEKILKRLAMKGLPLPEGQTPSEKKLIGKIREDLGLPAEPKTKSIRDKHEQAAKLGLLQPLEGKTPAEQRKILKNLHDLGIPLPEGRTPSEKALVAQVKASPRTPSAYLAPSERMRRAKAEGFLTPLDGKTPEQQEKILKGLAMKGLPLPEGQTPSEKKLIGKVRADLGLPAEPKTKTVRDKHEQAAKLGLLQPLEGKTPEEQKKILKGLHDLGVPLPEGRTPSEKALVAQVKASPRTPSAYLAPSERMRRAKAEGFLTPLEGKTPEQQEKILKGLAIKGLPLPEGQTPSEKKLISKVRADLGLPAEPKTKTIRDKHEQAAKLGLLQPLEGKAPEEQRKILKGLHNLGIPLPEGRTPSEKALVAQIKASPRTPSALLAPSERMRRAKVEGLVTPLEGKTPEQQEKILKGLAMKGLPLPEGQTPSEKKIIGKVREDLGLPSEPKTKIIRDKHEKAAQLGLLQPLEGKTPAEQKKILKGLHDLGIPLPEGRTPSEKALVAQIKSSLRTPSALLAPSERMRRAKLEGLLTPLEGKTPEQQEKILKGLAMKGLPLPEGQTPSEKKLIGKVREDLGLPSEPKTKIIRDKHEQAAKLGLLQPLEGKTAEEQRKILKGLHDLGVPLPEGRTPSEKALVAQVKASPRTPSAYLAPSERMRRAKAEGFFTPLEGKTPEQQEKILKGLAMKGLPLPEGQTPSEKKLISKVREDLGLPAEPKTKSIRDKHEQAAKLGLLQPLEGKTPEEQRKILKGLHDLGVPLPEGRTPSEKALLAQVKASPRTPSAFLAPSERLRRAKVEGLLTPLEGKTPEQKEKILKGLAMKGLPLPEGQTPSEKKMVDKVREDLGLPAEPKTKSIREKHEQAAKLGLMQPLEGKTPEEKEKILKGLQDMGITLPEGRTPSEKALVAKLKTPPSALALSEKLRRAKAEGLLTPLKGKTPEEKEKIIKGLAIKGLPLPEAQTPSEKKVIDKVRADLGLPAEPKTKSIRDKHEQAAKAGLLQPLEGKTPEEKEKILIGLANMGIPLPEGRTPSEKALIAKVKAPTRVSSIKTAGLMTPLMGKSSEHKEKILRARAFKGLPLPEGQTPSEKKLTDKVRADLGLPTEPKTKSIRDKHEQAAKLGLLQPLEGKTPEEQRKILKGLHDLGVPLPEGRTPSEKALVAQVKALPRTPTALLAPSERLRRAKAEGLLTPLEGKTSEQKETILKGLAMNGLPLPEGKTPSENKLIDKVRADLGLPEEPKSKSIRDKHEQAAKLGLLQPLEGKTPAEKEKILKGLHDLAIPLPAGRTPSEKALVDKIKAGIPKSIAKAERAKESLPSITSDKLQKAKAAGLLTPLAGKTPEHKEKILQGLAQTGLPLPEGKTLSDLALIAKVKKDFGIPDRTPSEKLRRAKATGLLTPLEDKTPAQKERILRGRAAAGLPLPAGKSPSERALIQKIKNETGFVTPSPSERLRKAKAAGLLTPLKGKTPSMKAKILHGMKAAGVPIPEGQTPSEKKLISKLISEEKVGLEGIPSEKIRKAKAAGLLTPLEGKSPAQKQKILQGLADAGLPLPEGKTKSEKSMIAKVKARTPPEAITPSEKSVVRKAKAAGLFTPITGKAPAEKERILKGLAAAGLPLPVGKTASEKDLVKKIRAEAGLPLEATPSEKRGKIRKKEKKVGISPSKKAAGIEAEEFEDIIKTTTCDRGCGCDKKKIKFKHSYVKIRVTSPDISSFCDCPGECVPGVKSGAFIDNDGIKVTVGSAVGIPSYSMEFIKKVMLDQIISNRDLGQTQTKYHNKFYDSEKSKHKVSSFKSDHYNMNQINHFHNTSSSDISDSTRPNSTQSENSYVDSRSAHYQAKANKFKKIVESLRSHKSWNDIYKGLTSRTKSASSFHTILIIKSSMALSTSKSNSMETISLISVMDSSSVSSSSAHYSGFQSTNDLVSIDSQNGPTTSSELIYHTEKFGERSSAIMPPQQYTLIEIPQLEYNFRTNKTKAKKKSNTEDPIVLLNHLPSGLDVSKTMLKTRFKGASSVFIVVPMSDDEGDRSSSNDSIPSVKSSKCYLTSSSSSNENLAYELEY